MTLSPCVAAGAGATVVALTVPRCYTEPQSDIVVEPPSGLSTVNKCLGVPKGVLAFTEGAMEEEWRAVAGYEGWYSVSNLGRIRRDAEWVTARGGTVSGGRILQTNPTKSAPYTQVRLSRHGAATLFRVHRLVAAAFFGPCPAGHEVDHIDGNRANNRTDNLEYATHLENMRRRRNPGRNEQRDPITGRLISSRVNNGSGQRAGAFALEGFAA